MQEIASILIILSLFTLVILTPIIRITKTTQNRYRRRHYARWRRWRNTPERKGSEGEAKVVLTLGGTIPGKQYMVNNLILQDEYGRTSQIDHILINKNGVFVIETKNYSGLIYGSKNDEKWTQVLNYGKIKNKFYNPVKQNETHVNKLKHITKTELPIYSLVVFIRSNTNNVTAKNVYTLNELKRKVNTAATKNLSVKQMENLYRQLKEIQKNNTVTEEQHVENIKRQLNGIERNK